MRPSHPAPRTERREKKKKRMKSDSQPGGSLCKIFCQVEPVTIFVSHRVLKSD